MSWNIGLFIDCPSAPDALSREIGNLLGIRFKSIDAASEPFFEYRDTGLRAILKKHHLSNDSDLDFENYHFELAVWAESNWDWEASRQKCCHFARCAFEKLKTTQKYRLILVEDVQKKLDSFDPAQVTK